MAAVATELVKVGYLESVYPPDPERPDIRYHQYVHRFTTSREDQAKREQVDADMRAFYAERDEREPLPSGVARSSFVAGERVRSSKPGSREPHACLDDTDHRMGLIAFVVADLQPWQRQLLELRYRDKLSVERICERLDKSPKWYWARMGVLMVQLYWAGRGYTVHLV